MTTCDFSVLEVTVLLAAHQPLRLVDVFFVPMNNTGECLPAEQHFAHSETHWQKLQETGFSLSSTSLP